MPIVLEVLVDSDRNVLAWMRAVQVDGGLAASPANAKTVLVRQVGMRANEHATGTKKPVVGQALEHLGVPGDDAVAAQGGCCFAQLAQVLSNTLCQRVLMRGQERTRRLIIGADVGLSGRAIR